MKKYTNTLKSIFSLLLIASLFTVSVTSFLSWKANAVEDNEPPELISLEFFDNTGTEITEFSTETEDVEVTIKMKVVDSGVGVNESELQVNMRSRQLDYPEYDFMHWHSVSFNFERDEDSGADMYKATSVFPRYSAKGEWSISTLHIADNLGNSEYVDPASLATLTNTATTEDIIGPVLHDFRIPEESKIINTETEEQTIEVFAKITDNLTTLNYSYWTMAPLSGREQTVGITIETMELEGEGNEDWYRGTATFPQGAAMGDWELVFPLEMTDSFSNPGRASEEAVLAMVEDDRENIRIFNAATTENTDSVAAALPEITSLKVTPNVFDTTTEDVEMTIEIGARAVEGEVQGISVRVYPLFSSQEVNFEDFERFQGTNTEGTWRATATIPKYSKVGIWTIGEVRVWNSAGGQLSAWEGELMSVPEADIILINSATSNSVTLDNTWHLNTDKVMVTFEEGTVITKTDGGDFAFYRLLSQFYDMAEFGSLTKAVQTINSAGAEEDFNISQDTLWSTVFACEEGENCTETEMTEKGFKGDAVGLLRTGIPGIGLSFSKPVEIEIKNLDDYEGQEFFIQTFQEGGDEWTDETSCIVEEVEYFRSGEHGGGGPEWEVPRAVSCIFHIDHASFFSMSVLGASSQDLSETGSGVIAVVSFSLACVLTYVLSTKYMFFMKKNA